MRWFRDSGVRLLGPADADEVLALLARDPISNLYLLAQAHRWQSLLPLAGSLRGYYRRGRLHSVFFTGGNLVLGAGGSDLVRACSHEIGVRRSTSAIMGPSQSVSELWELLRKRKLGGWANCREARLHQPILLSASEADGPVDMRVRQITNEELDVYFPAALAMYREEVGPLASTSGYRQHVGRTINRGWAYGIVADGEVVFKADIGLAWGEYCQIQGVWLHPRLRGQGMSVGAMNRVLQLCRARYPKVTLYVNDFNTPALRLYQRLGMVQVGEYATIMF